MAIDENSKTPGLPNLEQLIAEEKVERERQNEILNERSKKKKRNKLLIIIPMATVSVLLIGGIAVYDPFAQNFRWGEAGAKAKENSQSAEGTSGKPVGNGEWWEQTDKSFPVAVPPWAQEEAVSNSSNGDEVKNPPSAEEEKPVRESALERFNRSDKLNGLYDEIAKSYYGQTISQVAGILPSREGGYTDDASKAVNADGSLNGDFSFWTREGFVGELGAMLNRLNNPVFGGWQAASEGSADESTKDKLSDLFTSNWLNANEPWALPILTTDTSPVAVNYLPSGGVRWVGTVNQGSENLVFNYDKDLKNYVVDYSADVTYSVWGSDQKVVTLPGKLALKLVPNSNGQNVNSGNRVLISESSLTLG